MGTRTPARLSVVVAIALTFAAIVGFPVRASAGAPTATTTTTSPNPVGPASALACKASTLRSARLVLEQQLSARATQLLLLATRITNTKDIPRADAATLFGIVFHEQISIAGGGIKGLESKVAAAPNCGALIADARIMVKDFWVYALVSPQVDLTAVASVESTIDAQLAALEPNIASVINAAVQRGMDESNAQAAFSDLEAKLAAAQSSVSKVSITTLLAQQPADFPADLSTLVGYHNDVSAAGSNLGDVSSDIRSILGDLA
jgi:hypothetical protein